jgi:hypothetical protein
MSPTPTITEAPLSATSVAIDAAGGGVMSTRGLHPETSSAMSNTMRGPEYRLDSMTFLTLWMKKTRRASAQKFRPSPSRNPV